MYNYLEWEIINIEYLFQGAMDKKQKYYLFTLVVFRTRENSLCLNLSQISWFKFRLMEDKSGLKYTLTLWVSSTCVGDETFTPFWAAAAPPILPQTQFIPEMSPPFYVLNYKRCLIIRGNTVYILETGYICCLSRCLRWLKRTFNHCNRTPVRTYNCNGHGTQFYILRPRRNIGCNIMTVNIEQRDII